MAKKNILTHSKKKKAQALMQSGQFAEAKSLCMQICAVDKTDSETWFFLGIANGQLKNGEEAERCFRQAINVNPGHALAYYNLGMTLRSRGRFDEAVRALREAARLEPQRTEILLGLAHTYVDMDRPAEAAACYRDLTRLRPNDADMHFNLGMMLHVQHRLEEAVLSYRRSLELRPDASRVYNNLGSAYCEQGKYEEALECHRQALKANPSDDKAHSNLLMTLLYLPDQNPLEALTEYRRWERDYGQPAVSISPHLNPRDPERRLRIGYVSPDFRTHSVAYFFEPLLANHDKRVVETVCYSTSTRSDATTERLQSLACQWRDVSRMGAEQAAGIIRSDRIDILVDLAGHTAGNGLKIFLHKPAPVQVTYLGYPHTTGLSAVDYRLTDLLSDPPGQEEFYTEKLVRLSDGFLCYQPPADSPPVSPLPASITGHVTFGSFNNLAKINPKVVALWAELLANIAGSRLLVKNASLDDPPTRERFCRMFEACGIKRERVELLGYITSLAEHLALYERLDIALDTFPYNGTTTTCEAMWMGVPVITLVGPVHAGRVGASLLNNAGLTDWVAETSERYVAIASDKARDLAGLAALRAGLRARLAVSPLCNGKTFASKIEAAYRDMWRVWCAS